MAASQASLAGNVPVIMVKAYRQTEADALKARSVYIVALGCRIDTVTWFTSNMQ